MKKFLIIILFTQACTSTAMQGKLATVSPKMSCLEINEQITVADNIISAAGGVDIDTNIARKTVGVGGQVASVAGYGNGFIGLANSLFSLGTSVYDQDQRDIKQLAIEAEQKKLDLEALYYDKEC